MNACFWAEQELVSEQPCTDKDCEDGAMMMRLKVHKSHSDMVRSQKRNRVNQFTLSFHSFPRRPRRNAHTFESEYCGKYILTA